MSDLFGAPSGVIAFHQDQDQQVATQQRFAQMQHLGALTEQTQMQTQLAAVQLQRQEKMLSILAQGPETVGTDAQGNPITPADKMTGLGTRLIEGGFFKEGGALVNQASEVKTREIVQSNAAIRAKVALGQIQLKKYDSLNNMLAASNDPESFAAAKMVWLNENPGETIPPQLATYDPTVIATLKTATKAGQEQLRRQQAETLEADKDAYRQASLAERQRHNAELELHQKAVESYQDRSLAARVKTTGTKAAAVGSPKNADVQAAHQMITRDFPDLEADMPLGKDNMVSSAAYDLANEAKAAMAKNRGLSMTEAMVQAYGRMKDAGDFRVTPRSSSFLDKALDRKVTKYTPVSQQPAEPYVAGQTKPEVGKIYDPGDGSKWRFDAKRNKMVSVE